MINVFPSILYQRFLVLFSICFNLGATACAEFFCLTIYTEGCLTSVVFTSSSPERLEQYHGPLRDKQNYNI